MTTHELKAELNEKFGHGVLRYGKLPSRIGLDTKIKLTCIHCGDFVTTYREIRRKQKYPCPMCYKKSEKRSQKRSRNRIATQVSLEMSKINTADAEPEAENIEGFTYYDSNK